MTLIFCYGSNLDPRRMSARCPDAEPFGEAELRGYRIAFAGYSPCWKGAVATLLPCQRSKVEGYVWKLDDADLARLDAFEGVPLKYARVWTKAKVRGRSRRVELYVLREGPSAALPSADYVTTIGRAYRALGFDPGPLIRAVKESGR